MTGGGGLTEVHILYPKQSQRQNLPTQKNHYSFLVYPKKLYTSSKLHLNTFLLI